ncbi:MAG: hypothetical protein K1X74_02180 [Pirellulales bacterium]|nr:hypothetical protein [Pirellulales bacterium]
MSSNREDRNEQRAHVRVVPGVELECVNDTYADILIAAGLDAALWYAQRTRGLTGGPIGRFAAVSRAAKLTAREALLLEAAFGPVIFDAGVACSGNASAAFGLLPVPAVLADRRTLTLDEKRAAIWHNTERNEQIRDFVMEYRRSYRRPLSARWPLAPKLRATLEGLRRADSAAAIIVETVEHGRILQELLPDSALRSLAPRVSSSKSERAFTICTQQFVERHGLSASLVIRADGPGAWPCSDSVIKVHRRIRQLVVLDVLDVGPDRPAAWTRMDTRLSAYVRQGWELCY